MGGGGVGAERKIHSFLEALWKFKLSNIKSLEEDNKRLKHVASTSEDKEELFLIKIKPLRPLSRLNPLQDIRRNSSQDWD